MPNTLTYILTQDELTQLSDKVNKNYTEAINLVKKFKFKKSLAYIAKALIALQSEIASNIDPINQTEKFRPDLNTFTLLGGTCLFLCSTILTVLTEKKLLLPYAMAAMVAAYDYTSYHSSSPELEDISFFENNKNYLNENQKHQISKILYLYGMIHFKNGEYEKAEKSLQLSFDFHHQDQNESTLIYYYCFCITQEKNKLLYKTKLNDLLKNKNLSNQNQLLLPLLIDLLNNANIAIERFNQAIDSKQFDSINYENLLPLFIYMQMPMDQQQDKNITKTFSFIELYLQRLFFNADEKKAILKSLITSFSRVKENRYADLEYRIMHYLGAESIKFKRDKSDPNSSSILATGQGFYFLGRKHYGSGMTAKVVKKSYPFHQNSHDKVIVKITNSFQDEENKNNLLSVLNKEAKKLNEFLGDSVARVACTSTEAYLFMTKFPGKELYKIMTGQLYPLFTFKDRMKIFKYILEDLLNLWRKGGVHLDIKPENIIVKFKVNNNTVCIYSARLIDLGFTEKRNTEFKGLVGSPAFMSPLIAEADNEKKSIHAEFKLDGYSLSVLLANMMIADDQILFEDKDKAKNQSELILTPFNFHGELGGTQKTKAFWQNAIQNNFITPYELERLTKIMKALQQADGTEGLENIINDINCLMSEKRPFMQKEMIEEKRQAYSF